MNKKFYSHIIEIESLIIELDQMGLSLEQKHNLAQLLDSSLHHTIIDAVLSELSDSDKQIFLDLLNEDDHGKIWDHLNQKVDHIEDKIKLAAENLKQDMHKDIKHAKRFKE